MGDFFNEMVIFLEDYYVYVVGAGLIIVLMLIGFLASSRKSRKETNDGEKMANINDVNTGSIDDVANTIQNDNMQPVDVVTFPETAATNVNPELTQSAMPQMPEMTEPVMPQTPEMAEPIMSQTPEMVGPIMSQINESIEPITPQTIEPASILEPKAAEPVAPTIAPVSSMPDFAAPINSAPVVDNMDIIMPVAEQNQQVEEITPVSEDRFDKTEVIDFSTLEPEKPVEVKPNDFTPFVVSAPQNTDNDSILNGETSSIEKPKNQQ
jgi:hypothetical protein